MPHRIRVNSVYPGWTDTPGERKFITEEAIAEAGEGAALGPPGHVRGDRPRRALPRRARQRFITGTILHIDGGLFLPWWSKRGEENGF